MMNKHGHLQRCLPMQCVTESDSNEWEVIKVFKPFGHKWCFLQPIYECHWMPFNIPHKRTDVESEKCHPHPLTISHTYSGNEKEELLH